MKELLIEEKAKLYDEAIIRAKSLIGDTIIEESGQHIAEVIFPELAESEDERIRNLLYCLIRDRNDNRELLEHNGVSVDMALAWLEKQREQQSAWSEEDSYMLEQAIKCVNNSGKLDISTEEIEYWLKSLRPQKQWKPSKLQMKYLHKYAEQNNYDGAILTSLYNDLK